MTPDELKGFVALLKEAGMSGPTFQGQRATYQQMKTFKPYKPKKQKTQKQKINQLAAKARQMGSAARRFSKGAQMGSVGGFGAMTQSVPNMQGQTNQAFQPRMNNAVGDQNALLPGLPSLSPQGPGANKPVGVTYPGAPPTASSSSGAKAGSGSFKSAEAFKRAYLEMVKASQKKK